MKRTLAIAAIFLALSSVTSGESHVTHRPHPQKSHWNKGTVTVYAARFEGRPMANGKPFHHRNRVVACRGGQLNRKIEIRYGRNGRSVAIICDRGRLPMHRTNCWQFDVTKTVAQDLGLYRLKNGRTDRSIEWRYLD